MPRNDWLQCGVPAQWAASAPAATGSQHSLRHKPTMRDFKAGRDINVPGVIQVFEAPPQPKLLAVCDNDELVAEREHRQQLLAQERKLKSKRLAIFWLVCVIVIAVAALWLYIQGKTNLSGFILGVGGLGVSFISLNAFEQPTEFEARQSAALKEIQLLLRERGVMR